MRTLVARHSTHLGPPMRTLVARHSTRVRIIRGSGTHGVHAMRTPCIFFI